VRSTPEGLDESAVLAALREDWNVDVASAEYAAVGAGSYHWTVSDTTGARSFVTVDDLDQKSWLGDGRDAAFHGLRCAFDTSVSLREHGLRFVVAPRPTRTGASLRRLDSRYTVALFPFVEGDTGEFGAYADERERHAVVELLAELHRSPASSTPAARRVGLAIPGREHLERALRDLDETWTGGPLSERARTAVRDSASALAELLALADRLASDVASRGGEWVVTHGEPHRANVLRTPGGPVLVDWDTVALAPPERDLWMAVETPADADLYASATGTAVDDTALDFFRLTWDLKDAAEYLSVLRGPHEENEDTLRQCGALVRFPAIRDYWEALLA